MYSSDRYRPRFTLFHNADSSADARYPTGVRNVESVLPISADLLAPTEGKGGFSHAQNRLTPCDVAGRRAERAAHICHQSMATRLYLAEGLSRCRRHSARNDRKSRWRTGRAFSIHNTHFLAVARRSNTFLKAMYHRSAEEKQQPFDSAENPPKAKRKIAAEAPTYTRPLPTPLRRGCSGTTLQFTTLSYAKEIAVMQSRRITRRHHR